MATSAKTEQDTPSPEARPAERPAAPGTASLVGVLVGVVVDVVLAGFALGLAAWLVVGPAPRPIVDQRVVVTPTASVAAAAVTVRLGPDNRLAWGNEDVDEATLVDRLLADGQPPATAALVVSGNALYANVAAAVGLLRRSGVREVYISVGP